MFSKEWLEQQVVLSDKAREEIERADTLSFTDFLDEYFNAKAPA